MSIESSPDGSTRTAARAELARIGILMLDTGFERLPGDVGQALTWPFPVTYRVVRGASGARVTQADAGGTLELFAQAADELAATGVDGITTTCGFLALLQNDLAARCPVPFASSSLLQVPMVQRLLPPGAQVGILTANAQALTPAHLAAVGAGGDLPIAGLPGDSCFRRALETGAGRIDAAVHERELLALTGRLVREHPQVRAIVSECANFPPHSAAISEQFGLPVYDAVTMVTWFQAGLSPRRFR